MTLTFRLVLLCALLIGGASLALAQEQRSSLLPDIPKATGEPHPEGNAFWRKNHMDLMRHDRDLTMRDGNRDIEASLKGCFDCHTTKDDTGEIVTYASEQHFCRACHEYVAVKVDCFMCHRSTPDGVDEHAFQTTLVPPNLGKDADIRSVIAYLNQEAPIATEAGK